MGRDTLVQFDKLIARPHGIVLVTAPTGSGKTTTLYASMSRLETATTNIMTVEDPIEYDLGGIGQTQVNERIGMTFARALRSILRQDPDVIMIGEIRDLETAQIAVQASLTGHLVLATLHTNDAASAVTRLTDMGVGPTCSRRRCSACSRSGWCGSSAPSARKNARKKAAPCGIRSAATSAGIRGIRAGAAYTNCCWSTSRSAR